MSGRLLAQPSLSRLGAKAWRRAWQQVLAADEGPVVSPPQIVEQTWWGAIIWKLPSDTSTGFAAVGDLLVAAPGTDPAIAYRAAKRWLFQHRKIVLPHNHVRYSYPGMLTMCGVAPAALTVVHWLAIPASFAVLVAVIVVLGVAYVAGCTAPSLLDRHDRKTPSRRYDTLHDPSAAVLVALDTLRQVEDTIGGSAVLGEVAWVISTTDDIDLAAITAGAEIASIAAGLPPDQRHAVQHVLPDLLLAAVTAPAPQRGSVHATLSELRDGAKNLVAIGHDLEQQIDPHSPETVSPAGLPPREPWRQSADIEEARQTIDQLDLETAIRQSVRDDMRHRDAT